ncbi:hypothetical protein F5Y16DRAFT_381408 [Xylariaceae sp. FL0255]|nr:hypothetical protein F5Y16DRAFT_381408 [Xylariaceae sp. FL0255]
MMACQSCQRQLSLLARQTTTNSTTSELLVAATAKVTGAKGRQLITSRRRPLSTLSSSTVSNPPNPRTIPLTTTQHQQRRTYASKDEEKEHPSYTKIYGAQLRRWIESTNKPFEVIAATKHIYKTASTQATYTMDPIAVKADTIAKTADGEHLGTPVKSEWFDVLNFPPTFSTWAQVTMLHLWTVFARARDLPREQAKNWQAQLTDHFFFDAEERMDLLHGISSRGLRQRYLKDLFQQWRGVVVAYDEGLFRRDAILASAVWRNLFKADPNVNFRDLAAVVCWIRLVMKDLDGMANQDLFNHTSPILRKSVTAQYDMVDRPVESLKQLYKSPFGPFGQLEMDQQEKERRERFEAKESEKTKEGGSGIAARRQEKSPRLVYHA